MVVDLARALRDSPSGELPAHFSQSQLGVFLQCPERYRVEYVQGVKASASSALQVGSGVHKGIETYLQLRDARITKSEREQRAIIAAGDYIDDQHEGAEEAEQAVRLVETFVRQAPPIEPVALEERIEVDLPGCDVPLVGYIDCVTADSIIEFKTAARSVNKPTGVWKVQAWLYQAAYARDMRWMVLVKNKEPKLLHGHQLRVAYDQETTRRALDLAASARKRIEQLYETIGPEQEWPLQGVLHPWACGMCAARAACIYGEVGE